MLVRLRKRKMNNYIDTENLHTKHLFNEWKKFKFTKIKKGIYLFKYYNDNWFYSNFSLIFDRKFAYQLYRGFYIDGFADNIEQILTYYPEIKTSKQQFIMFVEKINKKTHDVHWGEFCKYIGTERQIGNFLSEEIGFNKTFYYFKIIKVENINKKEFKTRCNISSQFKCCKCNDCKNTNNNKHKRNKKRGKNNE